MIRRILALGVIGAALLVPAAGHAVEDCNGSVRTIANTAYIDDRGVTNNGIWIYLESNDVPGLQSGGESPLGDADPCVTTDPAGPDTLIF